MPRPERLVKLLTLLHNRPGLDAAELAHACTVSERTLQRDLDTLTRAGFSVYFDHGYRLAAPSILPPITLTVEEALALRLAAETAAGRAGTAAAHALTLATNKLQQALDSKPLEGPPERQLALELPVDDPRTEALLATLSTAVAEQRIVRLSYVSAARRGDRSLQADPYRLLSSPTGWALLAYCHARRRILRIPVTHLKEVSVTRHRFRPVPPRLLERHLHPGPASPPGFHPVRVAYRPPLTQTLKEHPPVGALMWEEGPEGSAIFTMVAQRTKDLVPWLLACGDAVEVLAPASLRREIHLIARAVAARHATEVHAPSGDSRSKGARDPRSSEDASPPSPLSSPSSGERGG